MHLDPLYIQALPHLSHTGSSDHLEGVLELSSIDIGTRHFTLEHGIAYQVDLTNTGEAVLLSGKATAVVQTQCDRCLTPTALSLTGEVEGYFLFDTATVANGDSLEVYEEVDRDGRIDIAPPILAAIVVELPTVTVCGPSCEGAVSLVSDNDATSHTADEGDTEPESPFAALKDFKFEQEASE